MLSLLLAALLALAGGLVPSGAAVAEGRAVARLKAGYARPAGVPFPAGNPYTPEKAALGERLFHEPALSRGGGLACAGCHDPALGFADGQPLGRGEPGLPLARHTPTLWNLAWAPALFWDGHAASLEAQAKGPIENPIEMNLPAAEAAARLAAREDYRRAFAEAFPEAPRVDEANLLAALATYERTRVSPETRFDRWIAGDREALDPAEIRGFLLFNGKAGCARCHEGWAFTDHAFHDIGLFGDDRGRGAAIGLPAAEHAFKTPGLRELGRTAPYMHDGRFATLDAVLAHYEHGIVERLTLSRDLKRIGLTPEERADLLAFLMALTAEKAEPAPLVVAAPEAEADGPAAAVSVVGQRGRRFTPGHVQVAAGGELTIVNDDGRVHNVRIHDPKLAFDGGAMEPGQAVLVRFPAAGRYHAFCAIHPTMRLVVDVAEPSGE